MTKWWQKAVVYQIYPRSFQDSNDDGIGDLNGIRARLGYIKRLGVDVIWLNPIYQTPNADNGYDISDYRAINKEFGTMADFKALLHDAHTLGLRIVMDLVVNHTSAAHPWFVESRQSKSNSKRDYYIWQDPVNSRKPNDWQSYFGGSAWQYDDETDQYYLHMFAKSQPDLNWRNPEVRSEVYEMMRWWLDVGIDGFRMDVINFISKPLDYQNAKTVENGPDMDKYLQEMNRQVLAGKDVMTVGETPEVSPNDALRYAGLTRNELNMVFTFQHMGIDLDDRYGRWIVKPWSLVELKHIMSDWQVSLHGKAWNSLYWNNHDQPRVVSRFGNDTSLWREYSAKLLATVLHLMQGTPYIYQGEELGMTNAKNYASLADYRDIETINAYRELVVEKQVLTSEEMLSGMRHSSRDNARTPMQWESKANAGFTEQGVTPWIGLNQNYEQINVAIQEDDPTSVLNWYRRLIQLRHELPIIVEGDYELLLPDDPIVWAYRRRWKGTTLTVVANFSTSETTRMLAAGIGKLLLTNYGDDKGTFLRGYEVKVYLT